MFRSVFANNLVFNLHFMKVSTEDDNNFGYEKITVLVDNMSLTNESEGCVGLNKFMSKIHGIYGL